MTDRFERVTVASRAEWRSWLQANHPRSESVWVVTWKKGSGGPHVGYGDIVDEALCFGWIDSRPAKLDEDRSMLLVSPRRRGSGWSAINKRRIERLLADGLVAHPGLERIAAAKADGSWEKLDAVETLEIPPDLKAALETAPPALAVFEAFSPSSRRGILEWIAAAKRPDTRRKRVEETARLAVLGKRANFPADRG